MVVFLDDSGGYPILGNLYLFGPNVAFCYTIPPFIGAKKKGRTISRLHAECNPEHLAPELVAVAGERV